jgi:hypothetical protein
LRPHIPFLHSIPKAKKRFLKKGVKRRPGSKKRKESALIAERKNISPGNIGRLKLIMRKPIIPKRNENERFKKKALIKKIPKGLK